MNSSQDIIARLQTRVAQHPSTDLECQPPIYPAPTLSDEDIARAEEQLGFPLPMTLKRLYLHVANGGYGPGWGILPMDHPTKLSVIGWDRYCRANWDNGSPPPNWPDRFIRFCEWGCSIWSGIECSSKSCAVIRFTPDRHATELADNLVLECDSLTDWLFSWVNGDLT